MKKYDGEFKNLTLEMDKVKLENEAFSNYGSDKTFDSISVKFGENITDIPAKMFFKCNKLTSIVISDKLKTIGQVSFNGCSGLKDIYLETSSGTYKIASEELTADLTPELKDAVNNMHLSTIGVSAFTTTAFRNIILPSSLEKIDDFSIGMYLNGDSEEAVEFTFYTYNNSSMIKKYVSMSEVWIYTVIDKKNKGDVNLSGGIDISDSSNVLSYYANNIAGIKAAFISMIVAEDTYITEDELFDIADVNEDDIINLSDATAILSYYAEMMSGLEPVW